jgi:hypothetical protein
MNREKILEEIITLLRLHNEGLRGTIHQEPYKGDFFKLFAAAFNSGFITDRSQPGYMSSDALASTLTNRAPEVATGKTYQTLLSFWGEWDYAWRRCDELGR